MGGLKDTFLPDLRSSGTIQEALNAGYSRLQNTQTTIPGSDDTDTDREIATENRQGDITTKPLTVQRQSWETDQTNIKVHDTPALEIIPKDQEVLDRILSPQTGGQSIAELRLVDDPESKDDLHDMVNAANRDFEENKEFLQVAIVAEKEIDEQIESAKGELADALDGLRANLDLPLLHYNVAMANRVEGLLASMRTFMQNKLDVHRTVLEHKSLLKAIYEYDYDALQEQGMKSKYSEEVTRETMGKEQVQQGQDLSELIGNASEEEKAELLRIIADSVGGYSVSAEQEFKQKGILSIERLTKLPEDLTASLQRIPGYTDFEKQLTQLAGQGMRGREGAIAAIHELYAGGFKSSQDAQFIRLLTEEKYGGSKFFYDLALMALRHRYLKLAQNRGHILFIDAALQKANQLGKFI